MVKKKRKTERAGVGCLIQLLGLCLLIFFPIGTIIGVALLIVGGRAAQKLICGKCGNTVTKESKMCPTCHEELSGPGFFG